MRFMEWDYSKRRQIPDKIFTHRRVGGYDMLSARRSEQIPYGVKDFKRIRLEDFYYVDKTAFIRKLEARPPFPPA